jgi:methionyl-tRNA formyltransferase
MKVMSTRIVVVGNGQFAVNCLRLMVMCAGVAVPLVVADPELYVVAGLLPAFCRKMKLRLMHAADVNAASTIDAIRAARPDFVFSAYNMQIFKRPLLQVPRIATVNFHNGPLPRYRGVNVYSWAIINGEPTHGVTWHVVDEGIDTGDILGQQTFSLAPTDTPITLLSKGFRAGVECLAEILPKLVSGQLQPRKQNDALATYYSKRDLPNAGRINFEWTFDRIEKFVRGLDFRPFENRFVYPACSYRGTRFYPQTIRLVSTSKTKVPGSILKVNEDSIHVQAADAVVALSHILDAGHQAVSSPELQRMVQLEVGDIIENGKF